MRMKSISYAILLLSLMSLSVSAIGQTQEAYIPLHDELANLEKNVQIKTVKNLPTPFIVKLIPSQVEVASVQIVETSFEKTENLEQEYLAAIGTTIELETSIVIISGKPHIRLEVLPYKKEGSSIYKMVKGRLKITYSQKSIVSKKLRKTSDFAESSVLNSGNWHKLSTSQEGIYKITGSSLQNNDVSIANVSTSAIQLYGNPGGMVPEIIEMERTDDLMQVPIKILDKNGNGVFEAEDEILFYAHGGGFYQYNDDAQIYTFSKNVYSDENYYFLNLNKTDVASARIAQTPNGQGNSFEGTLDYYHHKIRREKDEFNFLLSGRDWYGDEFKRNLIQNFTFNVNQIKTDQKAFLRTRFSARSIVDSRMRVSVNDQLLLNRSLTSVSGDYSESFMSPPYTGQVEFDNASNIRLTYDYTLTHNDGNAWLDYFELSVPRLLTTSSGSFLAFMPKAKEYASTKIIFTSLPDQVWNISDYRSASELSFFTENGNDVCILNNNSQPVKLAYVDLDNVKTPGYVGKISNQNLHGLAAAQYVIIYHPNFQSAVDKLADFHRTQYGKTVHTANVRHIYNEFSSGRQDASAIRDFIRMLYVRGQDAGLPLENALLFGDGSYDYKDILPNNTNYIPTFQSRNSYVPVSTYASDDFFGILDENEGYYEISGAREGMDIGVGRLPVNNTNEADVVVEKIIRYHQPSGLADWRNRVTFLGDDEDGNTHFYDSESISNQLAAQTPELNTEKIYLDAYEQQSFGSGAKYPDVNQAIDDAFDKGHFLFNYLGHGGSAGMAHERVVTRPQIRNWSNTDALPLIITATCELSRYDDPSADSPGELMLKDPDGGCIALVTTTRLVRISLNKNLNEQVTDDNLFNFDNGFKTLGEIFKDAKNLSIQAINQRNFTLLGDPGVVLAYPKFHVETTEINGNAVGQAAMDTFKAFSKVEVKGQLVDDNGDVLSDFNGTLYPTIFDKSITYSTLANDLASSVKNYEMQNSVLYRGSVSVTNGKFSFQFVVPKDIAYQFGKGKISYYAENGDVDANGYFDDIIVGGSEDSIADDREGPQLELFMDDEKFVFGGLTGESPLLLARVFDENGINTVGNGIGRDITAILDKGTDQEKIIILNDFYTADLNSYQSGRIEYRLDELAPGRHTLELKIWDVYNNSSEAYTEFIVANDEDLSLKHVLNYPNPFTTNTTFHFDHNKAGQNLDVRIQILSVTGNVVQTLTYNGLESGGHFDQIVWNGKDRYGDNLARGMYLYKVSVKSEDGGEHEIIQKLLML
jgi:hypothetical protein